MASQGGTTERHAQGQHPQGQEGGRATAATHSREFYQEIGAKGGRSHSNGAGRDRPEDEETGDADTSGSHHVAAGFHESAAHHHRQAADFHARGQHEEGREHATTAYDHSRNAHAHSGEAHASSHKPRGGTSEQHAIAGKQSHKNN